MCLAGRCPPPAVPRVAQGASTAVKWTVIILLWLMSAPAFGALHKCKLASGEVRYSDRPCADAVQSETIQMDELGAVSSLRHRADQVGALHPSWLDTPAHLTTSARCVGRHCQCGDWKSVRNDREDSRLYAALRALPDVWDSYLRLAESEARAQRLKLRGPDEAALREAACAVRVEQELVVELYPRIVPELLDSRALAQAQANPDREHCSAPDIDTVRANDPRWSAYRECRQQAERSRRGARSTLNRTAYGARALDELLPPLGQPRPLRAR